MTFVQSRSCGAPGSRVLSIDAAVLAVDHRASPAVNVSWTLIHGATGSTNYVRVATPFSDFLWLFWSCHFLAQFSVCGSLYLSRVRHQGQCTLRQIMSVTCKRSRVGSKSVRGCNTVASKNTIEQLPPSVEHHFWSMNCLFKSSIIAAQVFSRALPCADFYVVLESPRVVITS